MLFAAVSISEQDLRDIFKLIVWSRLFLNFSQSTGPVVKEGLELDTISPAMDRSMGE